MKGVAFGADDVGVHADGTFGHEHVRARLSQLVMAVDGDMGNPGPQELAISLEGPMPDGAWDEEEAIDMLNFATDEDFEWEMFEGDLRLASLEMLGDERAW